MKKGHRLSFVIVLIAVVMAWSMASLRKDKPYSADDPATQNATGATSFMPMLDRGRDPLPQPTPEATEALRPDWVNVGNVVLDGGSIAYQTINGFVVAYDVADTAKPTVIAKSADASYEMLYSGGSGEVYAGRVVTATVKWKGNSVETQGELLYAMAADHGSVSLTSRIVVPGVVTDMASCGVVYVSSVQELGGDWPASLSEGVYVLGQSGSGSLGMMTKIEIAAPVAVACSGDRLYVSSEVVDLDNSHLGPDGRPIAYTVKVYNVSDPGKPVLLGTEPQLGAVQDIKVVDGKVFVVGDGVRVYSPTPQGPLTEIWAGLQGETVLGMDSAEGDFVVAIDAHESTVVKTGTITGAKVTLIDELSVEGGGWAPVYQHGDILVATGHGLRVVRDSPQGLAVSVDVAQTRDWFVDVAFQDDRVYALDWFGELVAYRFDPRSKALTRIGSVLLEIDPDIDDVRHVVATSDYALVIGSGPMVLIDVREPSSMRVVDDWEFTHPDGWSEMNFEADVAGRTVVVSAGDAGLVILEIVSQELVMRSSVPCEGVDCEGFALRDDTLFVSSDDDGLIAYDLSDPAAPRLVSSIALEPVLTDALGVSSDAAGILAAGWAADKLEQFFHDADGLSAGQDIVREPRSTQPELFQCISAGESTALWAFLDGRAFGLARGPGREGYRLGSSVLVDGNQTGIDDSGDAYAISLADRLVIIEVDDLGTPTIAAEIDVSG